MHKVGHEHCVRNVGDLVLLITKHSEKNIVPKDWHDTVRNFDNMVALGAVTLTGTDLAVRLSPDLM